MKHNKILKNIFMYNVRAKIVCFVIALALWFFIIGEETIYLNRTVPLEIAVPEGFVASDISHDSIRVELKGPRDIVMNIMEKKIEVHYSFLENIEPGTHIVNLGTATVSNVQPGYINRLSPGEIKVVLDQVVEKDLAVVAKTVGSPAEGFEIVSVDVEPTMVSMKGPRIPMESMNSVYTEPIDVTGKKHSFIENISLSSKQNIWPVKTGKKIQVVVKLETQQEKRAFKDIPVYVFADRAHVGEVKLYPSHVEVTVGGTKERLKQLQATDIRMYVEVMELEPGSYTLPLLPILPSEIALIGVSHNTVEVQIGKELEL